VWWCSLICYGGEVASCNDKVKTANSQWSIKLAQRSGHLAAPVSPPFPAFPIRPRPPICIGRGLQMIGGPRVWLSALYGSVQHFEVSKADRDRGYNPNVAMLTNWMHINMTDECS